MAHDRYGWWTRRHRVPPTWIERIDAVTPTVRAVIVGASLTWLVVSLLGWLAAAPPVARQWVTLFAIIGLALSILDIALGEVAPRRSTTTRVGHTIVVDGRDIGVVSLPDDERAGDLARAFAARVAGTMSMPVVDPATPLMLALDEGAPSPAVASVHRLGRHRRRAQPGPQ